MLDLHPESAYEGREPVSGRYKVTEACIAYIRGKTDNGEYAHTGLALKADPVGHDTPFGNHPALGAGWQFIKGGDASKMLPSVDGETPTDTDKDGVYERGTCFVANPDAGKVQSLNAKAKLNLFLVELLNQGFDPDKTRVKEFSDHLVGIDADFDEAQEKFTDDNGKEQTYGVLIVRKLHGEGSGGGSSARKSAGSKKAKSGGDLSEEQLEKAVEIATEVIGESDDPVDAKSLAAKLFSKSAGIIDNMTERQNAKREFSKGEGAIYAHLSEHEDFEEEDGAFVAA